MAEHFADLQAQHHAARLGVWVFLSSEVMLFGGLFAMYGAYYVAYTNEFREAAHHNTVYLGSANTVVLITSSLTVALAVRAMRQDRVQRAELLVSVTIGLGLVFLAIKAVEYGIHFQEGLLPAHREWMPSTTSRSRSAACTGTSSTSSGSFSGRCSTSSDETSMRHRTHLGFWGYVGTWLGLLALTGLTFGLSFVHTGAWTMPLAVLIASVKALLVAVFFMHLVEQSATNRIVASVSILFLALLIGLMALDVGERARWGLPSASAGP